MRVIVRILLISVILFSCSKPSDPENVLRDYVRYRFGHNQSKDGLLAMTAESLKASIESMSDEEFLQFTDMNHIGQKDLRILNKKCEELECYITYIVKYGISDETKKTYDAEIKKVAKLMKVDGQWKVSDINNIKTFYNSKDPLNINIDETSVNQ